MAGHVRLLLPVGVGLVQEVDLAVQRQLDPENAGRQGLLVRPAQARRGLYAWYGATLDFNDADAVALWRQEVESGIAELTAILKAAGIRLELLEAETAFAAAVGNRQFAPAAH